MRQRKIAPAIVVVVLLALSPFGARAGTIDASFLRITGVEMKGKTSRAQVEFYLHRLEGATVFNKEAHALPVTGVGDFKAAVYLDRGPLQNPTSLVQFLGGALMQGCITVKIDGQEADSGCTPLESTTLNMDPAGQSGTINFSVYSTKWAPRQLLVNLVVSGNPDLGPDSDNSATQSVTPTPPESGPYSVTVEADQMLARTLTIVGGSVRSEHLALTYGYGGGAIVPGSSLSRFITGGAGSLYVDSTKPVCPDTEVPKPLQEPLADRGVTYPDQWPEKIEGCYPDDHYPA